MAKTPPGDSDEALMGRYLDGDAQAFELLYRRHAARVRAFALKRLGRPEEADEVTQRVFMKFHTAREQYDPAYRVLQWLFVIARTAVVDHARARGRDPLVLSDQGTTPDAGAPPGQEALDSASDDAEKWLDRLPAEAREAVKMRVIDESSYEEIAEKLGKSEAGVRQTVSRALRRLKTLGVAGGRS